MKIKLTHLTILCLMILCLFTGCSDDSEITIVSGGDLLISENILEGAKDGDDYDFSHIFEYVKDYIKDADYAVINLETSFAGEEAGYCGFPKFNTPETLVDAAIDAGFDMFLTASNHSYDLGYDGLIYKLNLLEEQGVDYIGTRKSESDSFHKIVEVKGVKIGMLNYTQETSSSTKENVILNTTRDRQTNEYSSVIVASKGVNLIAHYNQDYLDEFFEVLKGDIEKLKAEGADFIVAYPHWGKEYNISVNETEDLIAQTMCDYGVDIIIGGHPHVVEPVKVYTSDISGKTTVCLHSTGNFVSSMRSTQEKNNAAYTEDGVLFEYTIRKNEDGTFEIDSVNALPLWVKKSKGKKYATIPLDMDVDWEKSFDIYNYSNETSSGYQSYLRTTGLIEAGIKEYNNLLNK